MRRSVSFLRVALVSLLVHAAGCAVPPSRFGRDVSEFRDKLSKMQDAVDKGDWNSALSKANEIARFGDELSAKVLIGDPLRKTLDDALARAREVRKEAREHEAQRTKATGESIDEMARRVLEAVAAKKKGPSAVPPGGESKSFLESISGIAPAAEEDIDVADAGDDGDDRAGGEVDLDRHASIVQGDREGDISDDEISGRRRGTRRPKKKKSKKLRIDENTPPIVITDVPITKGKSVVAYFTLTNNTDDFKYVVSVSARFIRESGGNAGYAMATFNVKGFVPKWTDILDSKGDALTGEGFAIHPMSGLQLAAVGTKPRVGKVGTVKLEVRMRNGKVYYLTGPKEPDPDEDED